MGTWNRLGCTYGLVGALGVCFSGCSGGRQQVSTTPVSQKLARCEAKYSFPESTSLQDNCPQAGCGLNGAWLGGGFKFRTFNLDGSFDSRGLRISGFRDKDDHPLELHVDDDTLTGYLPGQSTPVDLENAKLLVEQMGEIDHATGASRTPPVTYTFRIVKVLSQNSWAVCKAPGCGILQKPVPLYQFEVTNNDDGCNVPLCQPGLDENSNDGVSGTAVIFRGDTYDEQSYTVAEVSSSGPPKGGDHGVFNVACLGTTLSKLHFLGHTSASTANTTTPDQRQAMLRLLTADYCGVGHTFTDDGVPIRLGFQNVFQPSVGSSYALSSAQSIDAMWNQDGATCIGQPRKPAWTVPQIQSYCAQEYQNRNLNRPVPQACVPTQPTMNTLNGSGAMALSGNPAP